MICNGNEKGMIMADPWPTIWDSCRFIPIITPGFIFRKMVGKEPNRIDDDLIGGGLVTLNSALGRHRNSELNLSFPETHQQVYRNMNHWDLLNHPEGYEAIRTWLKM